jgi:cytidylate kinase
MKGFVVAIDGPAGAGKSTTARLVAQALGFLYLDTGAMYRAVTWKALEEGIALDDEKALTQLAESMAVDLRSSPSGVTVHVGEDDVTEKIRTPEISRAVPEVARVAGVRRALVERQREIGGRGSVVVEGRDIGTVVFPSAPVKVFLEASLEERARRRGRELAAKGLEQPLEELVEEIRSRDAIDSRREVSPLSKAPDALVLDTTGLTVEAQVEEVVRAVQAARARSCSRSRFEL